MNILEGLRGAWRSLTANKLRASLTMLGIVIGIAAVIAVVTIGMGGKAAVLQEMEKTGVNLFVLYPKTVQQDSQSGSAAFTQQDIDSLRRALPRLQYLLPASVQYAGIQINEKNQSAMVVGTTPEFAQLRRRVLGQGRFFSAEESAAGRMVTVLDQDLAANLFGAGNPLGQQVMIQNVACRVIGVLAKDTSVFAQFDVGPQNSYAYVPWSSWSGMFQSNRIDQLEGSTFQAADLDTVIESAKRLLNRRHGTTDQYEALNAQQLVQAADKITRILTIIVGVVAGISLLVGGIGIMNIMLVSVTERTREIGLRKAVGAKDKDILLQFLLEAILLAFAGGLIGIALGAGGAVLTAYLLSWPSLISGWAVCLAAGFSVAVGLFFGFYPARQAAKLEPIVALHYE